MTDALDALAGTLRERLVAESADGPAADRIAALVEREAALLDSATRADLVRRVTERALGLGPLQPLLEDPDVDEIMVSGLRPVWVERRGRVEVTDAAFATEAQLRDVIERVLAPAGRRVDEASPLADARLPDGSRVNVVIPPLAVDGPALTIRRFRRRAFTGADLVAGGTLAQPLLDFLGTAVAARCNVLVCGGTGSGKTTTLNVLGAFIGESERVVTIEDAAELRLPQPHVVRLEARPPSLEGRGEVPIRALVRNALRMRPGVIVGEVRGPEALDMLGALSCGHDGSLCTVHAGTPAEALRRVETLALMAGVGLPHAAIREQVADALDLVVCQARLADGTRVITEVAEVVRVAGGAGVRTLYALRDGRPTWRAALSETLATRLRLAAPALPPRATATPPAAIAEAGLGAASRAAAAGAGGAPFAAPARDIAGPEAGAASPRFLVPSPAPETQP